MLNETFSVIFKHRGRVDPFKKRGLTSLRKSWVLWNTALIWLLKCPTMYHKLLYPSFHVEELIRHLRLCIITTSRCCCWISYLNLFGYFYTTQIVWKSLKKSHFAKKKLWPFLAWKFIQLTKAKQTAEKAKKTAENKKSNSWQQVNKQLSNVNKQLTATFWVDKS